MPADGNLDFLDLITLAGFMMQIMNYQENKRQTTSDDLMSELQKQDKEYLGKILENQEKIMNELSDIKSEIRRNG